MEHFPLHYMILQRHSSHDLLMPTPHLASRPLLISRPSGIPFSQRYSILLKDFGLILNRYRLILTQGITSFAITMFISYTERKKNDIYVYHIRYRIRMAKYILTDKINICK